MRALAKAGVIALAVCVAPSAFAQVLPDSVRAAGVTVAQWEAVQTEVRRAASARGASERALQAVAERVSVNLVQNGHIDLDQLLHSIDERAQQVADLQTQLAAMERADDPAVAALLTQARAAIDAGDLTRGDQFLAQAAQSDLAGIARDQARLAARQTRAAQTISERGRLAYINADYLGAASFYAQAADTAPETDVLARWWCRMYQASALQQRGELFGEPAPLREAVRLYREVALPLAPPTVRAAEWASTQHHLGIALRLLGEGGADEHALRDAVTAFRAALTVDTRENVPSSWADDQNSLGNTLFLLGERGDDQALRDAVTAFRAALTVQTRESAPASWASVQNNLGGALRVLGERGDDQALRDAVMAFRAALTVQTHESAPASWAGTQNNLGIALFVLGERGDEQALRDAVTAFHAALTVDTRESAPAIWARDKNNLGNVLRVLGERGDEQALRDAVTAFHAALEVRTRASTPASWATTQNNLGTALIVLGERGDDQALRDAVTAFRAALTVDTRESARASWARDQYNLGTALIVLGERGDDQALRDAVTAFRAALTVQTRESAPASWADNQNNLALALRAQVLQQGDEARLPEALAAAQAALSGYEQVGNTHGAQRMRNLIAQLQGIVAR